MKLSGSFFKKGFSLIELSLTLVVISSLAVVAITKYAATEKITRENRVYEDFKNIKNAIDAYVKQYGYYPCPASPYLDRNDVNAGIGVRNAADVILPGPTVVGKMGGCNTNYSKMSDTPAWDNTSIPNIAGYETATVDPVTPAGDVAIPLTAQKGSGRLVYGAVPCRELGLPMDCGISPDGDRYEYVVGARQTMPQECQYYLTQTTGPIVRAVTKIPDPLRVFTPVGDGSSIPDDNFNTLTNAGISRGCGSSHVLSSLGNLANLDTYYGHNVHNIAAPSNLIALPADYALIYFGPDGVGSYKDNVTGVSGIHSANSIGGGAYGDDNKCQAENHKILNARVYGGIYDYYFLMPRRPFNPDIVFGDIVSYGTSANYVPTYCALCSSCPSGGGFSRVVKASTIPGAADVLLPTGGPAIDDSALCSAVSSTCNPGVTVDCATVCSATAPGVGTWTQIQTNQASDDTSCLGGDSTYGNAIYSFLLSTYGPPVVLTCTFTTTGGSVGTYTYP